MSASKFGSRFVVTTFGESHGPALGAVVEGCPAGVMWDEDLLLREIARRRPGQSAVTTARNESDTPELLSGVYEGRTLGTPIAMVVRNRDQRSEDYREVAAAPRAGHADEAWKNKFGHSDPRGGGRSSGRETVSRVIGGAVARMFLAQACPGLKVKGFASSIGPFGLSSDELDQVWNIEVDDFVARFPSNQHPVERLLVDAKAAGLSYGGTAEIRVHGAPKGLGQPVFHKLKADLAAAILSVGATAGLEIGEGFESTGAEGSEFHRRDEKPYGGILGGISTGEEISIRVAFKPTSSVMDVAKRGRHDPCIVPRAVPVLEAMVWLVLADHLLWARGDRL